MAAEQLGTALAVLKRWRCYVLLKQGGEEKRILQVKEVTSHTQKEIPAEVYRNASVSLRVLLSKFCKTISETVHRHGTDCSLLLSFYLHKSKSS